MRVTSSIPSFQTGTAITCGNFDGLHLGHMKLIRKLVETARHRRIASVMVTFNPHPLEYFNPDRKILRICDLPEMEKLLTHVGVDYLVRLPFDAEVSSQTPEQFWNKIILEKFKASYMIVGEDHQFGKARAGDPETLIKLGRESKVDVEVESHLFIGGEPVSSTRIRNLIERGDLTDARRLLGHGLIFIGPVLHGAGRGMKLGFPTANMSFPGRVLPPAGVFASRALIDDAWEASVSYVGKSPTFNGTRQWLETHIINRTGTLYNKTITVDLIKNLRPEIRFDSRDSLIVQMQKDLSEAKSVLNHLEAEGEVT